MVSANQDPDGVRAALFDPQFLPGFNDSGAHLTNMAFYDANLRGLHLAQRDGLDRVASHVRRLTKDPADFFGLDVGTLDVGARADVAVIDPDALAGWDTESTDRTGPPRRLRPRPGRQPPARRGHPHRRRRPPGLGRRGATPALGVEQAGRVLTAP